MRHTPVALLALALLVALAAPASASPVLTLHGGGRVTERDDPLVPATDLPTPPARVATRARAAAAPAVPGALRNLLATAQIDQPTYDARLADYTAARASLRKLKGARRQALGAVVDNLEAVARAGGFVPTRLPVLFETLRRNRQWWTTGPLLANGRRVGFPSSQLVWQYYAGQGLQIQWLGTFGKANGLWQIGTRDTQLRALLDEALGLATQRAGGIGFEYQFRFDGGRPPWVSGLAQGTAIQALSRAAVRLGDTKYFDAARAATGIYKVPPPEGVVVPSVTGVGAHYLIYSFAPKLRVLNAFVQSLNGLHDFALLANDPDGKALFTQGEAALRGELPRCDTGGWSRYSLQRDSDVSYHTLVRDFLRNLCQRVTDDRARPDGGAAPGADPAPYCATAARFTTYLKTKPAVGLASQRVAAGRRGATIRATTNKPGALSVSLVRGGRVQAVLRTRVTRSGTVSLRWRRPRPGAYKAVLHATAVNGQSGGASVPLRVVAAE